MSCLGAVVNRVSHNYSLVKDCFQKFFGELLRFYVDLCGIKKWMSHGMSCRKPVCF